MDKDKYDKQLINWAKDHYWDSLEKDRKLILGHLRTFIGDINNYKPSDKEIESLWPDLIVTPQEIVEVVIEKIELDILNREKPDALKEMKKLLEIFKDLNIGEG